MPPGLRPHYALFLPLLICNLLSIAKCKVVLGGGGCFLGVLFSFSLFFFFFLKGTKHVLPKKLKLYFKDIYNHT